MSSYQYQLGYETGRCAPFVVMDADDLAELPEDYIAGYCAGAASLVEEPA